MIELTYEPIDETCPFFDEYKRRYKIYNDGGHYVATLSFRKNAVKREDKDTQSDIDLLFDSLYKSAVNKGLRKSELSDFLKAGILKFFPDMKEIDEYVKKGIKRQLHNLAVRKKRFRRKAYMNKWNYFVTFTYDDKKHSEETFRRKLRRCLSNLHTRHGWRYMGVFEHAPETGRLHFHGLLYIPEGEMVGKIEEKRDYSTAQGKMQVTHSNDFFTDGFGRNDFETLSDMQLRHGQTLNYILKYIAKTGERIVYSRGIPTEIYKEVETVDIVSEFFDFGQKYVLFDDVIDWERDVMHQTNYRQLSFIDIICNPPRIA